MRDTPERTRLGPYRLLAVLERSGDDVFYRARHEARDEEVALRVMTVTDTAAGVDVRELIRLQALVHPNVVRILDVGQADDCVYVALEAWGEELVPLRRGPAQPFADRVRLVEEICAGMAAAHSMGLVHGNLHPFQVRLAKDGRAQVDFSERIASAAGGLFIGNPTYLQQFAPEMSEALAHWLLRSLAKEPEQRFQNGHEMVDSLRLLRRPN